MAGTVTTHLIISLVTRIPVCSEISARAWSLKYARPYENIFKASTSRPVSETSFVSLVKLCKIKGKLQTDIN